MVEAAQTVAACRDGVIGRMVCVDYAGCDAVDVLCDEETLKGVMDRLCEEIGIRVISNASKSFGPGAGVTSVNVLATSSLSVHTWPELGVACVDLFSCKTDFEDEFIDRFFAGAFGATSSARTSFDRIRPARTGQGVRA
jgi:S-adenosylmethionine decarboxylase